MTHEDRLRMEQDRRIREVRQKQYEVWDVTAQRVNAELELTETEIKLMSAEIALTEYEIAEMEG